MPTKTKKMSLLAEIIGSEITIPSSNLRRNNQQDVLQVFSTELYNGLAEFFGNSGPFFQTSLPLDRIVKYKDGSFSSMEKSIKGGFGQHQGFEIISSLSLAGGIMSHVIPQLNTRLIALYSDLLNQNNDLLNQLQDIFITPEISRLKSIQEFMREVANEIEEISKSPQLSTATLTNLQQRRIDLKAIFHTFFTILKQSVDAGYFDPQAIANNYLITRHALSGYMASLVLECVISGNVGNKSVANLKQKVATCLSELNSITARLSEALRRKQCSIQSEIRDINSLYQWSYDYMIQTRICTLHSHNHNIETMKTNTLKQFNINFEMQRIDDFISARHHLLEKIEIAPDQGNY